MVKFKKGLIPWNKGIKTNVKRCLKCGCFIGNKYEHQCKNVDIKGTRYCALCDGELKNNGWERYNKICGKCNRKIQRDNERILKKKLIKQFGGKCEICTYNKYIECLEFHHLFAEDKKGKHFLKDVEKHPEKFKLFCNRCHREIHIELNQQKNETYIKM